MSGIVLVDRNGLRWRDAPNEYGPYKMLYDRSKRWSDMGVFARIMAGFAADARQQDDLDPLSGHSCVIPCRTVDATYLEAHRTASSLRAKKWGAGV